MNFDDWMIHRGLSTSSMKKYLGAIEGPLSEWAIDNGLMAGPLTSLTSKEIFNQIARKIRELPVFQQRNERGHHMYSSALVKYEEYLAESFGSDIEGDLDSIISSTDLSNTEKLSLVRARIGQGTFRQKVLQHWKTCAVTGFRDTSLLVASHIKPWRASNNTERLDPFNGLMLSPNLDRVFDAGLITFDKVGQISISPLLTDPQILGISSQQSVRLAPMHEPYMSYHRAQVYRSA